MIRIELIIFLFLLLFAASSCKEDSPLDSEQYVKQVYIVGSDQTTNMGMLDVEVPFSDTEQQEIFISVATGGSLNIDREVSVTLDEAGTEPIDDYNFKYVDEEDIKYQKLESAHYSVPDNNVTIKQGDIYGRMPILVNSSGLHCDSLYALTFKISEVSDPGYISIRDADTIVILSFSFVNDYSGSYQAEGYYYQWVDGAALGDSVSISTSRTLKAVDSNTVRFFHLANTESDTNIANYAVTLSVDSDNNISVESWGNLSVTDGGGTYDPDTKTFVVWYNYISGSKEYQFSGTFIGD